ncbi:thioredoxin-like protein [Gonapodya prolifera JEL478]|uniref:Thioredoxin-like protein n=1 Tax=Gonapodya prolifera (strain JEL478) TaxID=1344416 RepID=A0A139ALI7_GONPJ|nr:thioredoxin-like protein [Gonapodya prolifera JEL478]|eukprot:KXS17373.1 thioredoxin-like protein [Gonapodya prolifera JEL478]
MDAAVKKLTDEAAGVGIKMDILHGKVVNTMASHRLIEWASQQPEATPDGKLVMTLTEKIYSANFERAEDIGDHEVLAKCAAECGLDKEKALQFLATDELERIVDTKAWANGRRCQEQVPCFIVEKRYLVFGAREPELWAELFEQLTQNG